MEMLGKVTLFCIMIVCGFLLALLGAKIILSIADLYGLVFLSNFSFVQIYGILVIINIIKFKGDSDKKKSEEKQDFGDTMTDAFVKLFGSLVLYLLTWGIAFGSFYILS